MARKRHPEPFWRESRSCWFVQVGGKQIKLSPDREEAWKLYHEIMVRPALPSNTPPPKADGMLVTAVMESYLDWVQANRSKGTYRHYRAFLEIFVKEAPRNLTVAELKPFHVQRIMDAHASTWSNSTRATLAEVVKGAFRWAERQGLVDKSPVRALVKPTCRPREMVVSPAEHDMVLAAVKSQQFRDLLELTWDTGARPQEVRAIEARHVDWQMNRIIFPASEAKGARRPRVIYLGTEKAREIVKRLAAEHPTGPILLNTRGVPWTRYSISCAFAEIKKRTGTRFHLGAWRKSFATEALKRGLDTVTVAALMGHSDAAMVSRIYGKVAQDPVYMADAARRARGEVKKG